MDCWERCARKAFVKRSEVAIKRLNVSPSYIAPEQSALLDQERDRVNALLALVLLLLKLNSRDSKAIEWASAHFRGYRGSPQ